MTDEFIADVLGPTVTMACFQNRQMVSAVPAAEQRTTVAHGATLVITHIFWFLNKRC